MRGEGGAEHRDVFCLCVVRAGGAHRGDVSVKVVACKRPGLHAELKILRQLRRDAARARR